MWVVLSVYDRKAAEFGTVFLARSNSVGARMFADVILGPQETIIRQHPEDFVLVRVGEFHETDGAIAPCVPSDVIEASEVVQREAVRVLSPLAGGESAPEL